MDLTFFGELGNCKNPPRKPTRAKRGSSRPRYDFRFSDQWKFSRTVTPSLLTAKDCEGIAYGGDFVALATQARRPLKRLEADFAWLAVAVYLADRFAPRYSYGVNGPAFWRRRIHLQIPVSDPDVWRSASDLLARTLEFLTEDDWSFEFVAGRVPFAAERQEHFRELRGSEVEWTSLFSGGLDSLAGALHWLRRTSGAGLLVSGQTNTRIAAGQEAQVVEIRGHFPQRIEHVFQKSFSCDRYPNYPHKAPQCGCCASCLVRRLSFHSAGLPDDGGNYSTDIFHPRRALRESELLALTKLTIQADMLATRLRSKEPWAALCPTWPDLLRTELELAAPAFREATVTLLHRHVDEWQSFSNAIHPAPLALAA